MKGGIYENKGKYGAPYYLRYPQPKGQPDIFIRHADRGYLEAVLSRLRLDDYEGCLDPRDYRKDNPLGFTALSNQWLSYKMDDVKCYRNLRLHIRTAQTVFEDTNIKKIGFGNLEDFFRILRQRGLSDKSIYNYKTTLHAFWTWAVKREQIEMPEFPTVKFTLGWRNTVDKDTQERIIEEVRRISYHINPKIWFGIHMLATYISVRPIELINIREGDIDLSLGVVNVKYNKESKPKIVPLLDEDIEFIKSFPRALPHTYFFRHTRRKGVAINKRGRFGKDYLYKWWKQACRNLEIDSVDLYGGTRHSSVRALREHFTPDQIKKASMHHTNKAFERYFQIELEDARKVYAKTKGEVTCLSSAHENRRVENSKGLK